MERDLGVLLDPRQADDQRGGGELLAALRGHPGRRGGQRRHLLALQRAEQQLLGLLGGRRDQHLWRGHGVRVGLLRRRDALPLDLPGARRRYDH